MTTLTAEELRGWAQLVNAACGVQLDASKGYLVEGRLGPLLGETRSRSYGELLARVQADATGALRRKVVDAITTGETSFFRDAAPFELLRHKVVPELVDRRQRAVGPGRPVVLRIWSAACSSGQEVYSLVILLKELLGDFTRFDVRILGTDISDAAVARASYGRYSRLDIERGLPPGALGKHFLAEPGGTFRVKDELRAVATFRTMNLLQPFAFPQRFDIVLCRNVAIYFAPADKASLFTRLADALAPDGALLVGSTETLTGVTSRFVAQRYLRAVFYEHAPPAVAAMAPGPTAARPVAPAPTAARPVAPTPARPVAPLPVRPSAPAPARPATPPPAAPR